MTKGIVQSCIAGISTIILLTSSSHAEAQARIKILDKMTYTINPSIELIGPVFQDQADGDVKSKYVSNLVRIILKEAHIKAEKYLEAGDTQAYYAYLTLALTVPLHEGLYIHFRSVDGDVCNIEANNAELIKSSGDVNYKIFNQYFKNPTRPYFPNCETMSGTSGIKQMIRGGDGTDLSIMQISIRWHFDDFLANKKYESVAKTLNYGFNHLLSGFDPVYRNIADYKCLIDPISLIKRKKINYINLVKGIWAGKYNSGSITQTCRFADPDSVFKKHDIGFSRNLDKILNFSNSISPDYIGEIKLEGDSAQAIKEIVSNLKNNKNMRTALSRVLNSSL